MFFFTPKVSVSPVCGFFQLNIKIYFLCLVISSFYQALINFTDSLTQPRTHSFSSPTYLQQGILKKFKQKARSLWLFFTELAFTLMQSKSHDVHLCVFICAICPDSDLHRLETKIAKLRNPFHLIQSTSPNVCGYV